MFHAHIGKEVIDKDNMVQRSKITVAHTNRIIAVLCKRVNHRGNHTLHSLRLLFLYGPYIYSEYMKAALHDGIMPSSQNLATMMCHRVGFRLHALTPHRILTLVPLYKQSS